MDAKDHNDRDWQAGFVVGLRTAVSVLRRERPERSKAAWESAARTIENYADQILFKDQAERNDGR